MFSSARGMAICIGVTGVASILLWFYFKNRIENVESKLDSMFEMIQNFSEDSTSTQQTQIYNEKQDDPFENKELEFVNQMNSNQLPMEMGENNENVKLITVSDNEQGKVDESGEESEEESGEESEEESEEESDKEGEESNEEEEEEEEEEEMEEVAVVKNSSDNIKSINLDLSEGGDSLDDMDSDNDESDSDIKKVQVENEVKEYSSMKVSELKSLCSEKGLSGYTKLNKAGLVNLLENN